MAGPLVAVAIWGGSYVLDCFYTLTANDSPIVYLYKTKGGYLIIRAESYQIDLDRNIIRAQTLTVREPEGRLLASLERAQVANAIPLITPSKKNIEAKLDGAWVRVERLRDGKLRLLDFMPEDTEEVSETPYTVTVQPLQVDFEDLGGAKNWKRTGRFPLARIDGLGSVWTAWTKGSIVGVGGLATNVHYAPEDGLTLEGNANKLDLAGILQHIATTKDVEKLPVLRDFTASKLIVDGPLRFFIPKKGDGAFEGYVAAQAQNFRYGKDFAADNARFTGLITHRGLRGSLAATGPGLDVDYVGSFGWEDEQAVGGSLVARSSSPGTAPKWLRDILPSDLGYKQGEFTGWLSYAKDSIRVDGDFLASAITFSGETISQPLVALSTSGDNVAVKLEKGTWNGTPITGAIAFNPKSKTLQGALSARNASIQTIARRFKLQDVSGRADVEALIDGTSTKPLVRVRGEGTVAARFGEYRVNFGKFDMAGRYDGDNFRLARFASAGPQGVLTGVGQWDRKTGKLNFDVLGSNVPIRTAIKDMGGTAAFSGKVSGTASNPKVDARVEAYDVVAGKQTIPLIVADVVADKERISAQEFLALKGSARADGSVAMRLKDKRLSGNLTASGIQLSELLGEAFSGFINVPGASVFGTLDDPQVEGVLDGKDLVVKNIKIDEVRAEGKIANSLVTIDKAFANLNQGTLTGSGQYNLEREFGTFTGKAEGVEVGKLATDLAANASVAGKVDGDIVGSFGQGQLTKFEASGNIRDLKINEAYLGNGNWTLNNVGPDWTASGSVGQIERFLELPYLKFNLDNRTIDTQIVSHNIAIENLYSAVERYIGPEDGFRDGQEPLLLVPDQIAERLRKLKGNLNTETVIQGTLDNPNLVISSFEATDLMIDGRESGVLTAKGTRTNGLWNIENLAWNGGPGALSAHGTIDEHGETNFEGDVQNLNTGWLAMFDSNFARFTGRAGLSFIAKGLTKSPLITTTFDYAEGPAESPNRSLSILANIQEGSITADGNYYVDGFTGPLIASIPFNYPFKIPADKELTAKLSLPPRELDSLKEFLPWMDLARTDGTVQGEVNVVGKPDDLRVTGNVQAKASRLAMEGYETTLLDLDAVAALQGTSLDFNARATGSDGGSLEVREARVQLGNLSEAVQKSFDALLENAVSGQALLNDFRIVQRKREATTTVGGLFSGNIDMSGTLKEPHLTGSVGVTGGSLTLGELKEVPEVSKPAINPTFDIALNLLDEMVLDAGTGQFTMTGGGRLGGSLLMPDAVADLIVEKGAIRLPTTRINIEPGGTVHVVYRTTPYGAPNTAALIDMTGHTFLTAPRFGNTLERYEITLRITGDILKEGGLVLEARSDPADLSQAQILSLLGQGEVFANSAGGSQSFDFTKQLQTAVVSVVLPYILGSYTDRIATSLGLDYFSIEYGSYNQLSVTAAKALGKNLVLSGSRQLNNPLPGQKLRFDIRLSYRLPVRNKLLSRLSFSIGLDQDRPWKIGIEYGIRF